MAAGIIFTVDTREFDKALAEYSLATGKTLAETANRAVRNLAFKGLALTKKAEAADIKAIESLNWWPKYIAKAMTKRKLVAAFNKMTKRADAGKKVKWRPVHYTREQARAFSRRIIRNRLVAVQFLKFFWLNIVNAAAANYKGGRRGTGKKFGGFQVRVRPATPQSPTCEITTIYPYKKRSDKTARRTDRLLQSVVPAAYAEAARDMKEFAEQRMAKDAQKYSARGAA